MLGGSLQLGQALSPSLGTSGVKTLMVVVPVTHISQEYWVGGACQMHPYPPCCCGGLTCQHFTGDGDPLPCQGQRACTLAGDGGSAWGAESLPFIPSGPQDIKS